MVSKNPGGSKRVTSLADALKLNFGIVTTDRRRNHTNGNVAIGFLDGMSDVPDTSNGDHLRDMNSGQLTENSNGIGDSSMSRRSPQRARVSANGGQNAASLSSRPTNGYIGSSPLIQSRRMDSESPPASRTPQQRSSILSSHEHSGRADGDSADEYTDERAREVITGRLIQGHIVDDDYPSPILSTMSGSIGTLPGELLGSLQLDDRDPMMSSFMSTASTDHPNGGRFDGGDASDEEEEGFKNPELEHTITLVGNVKDRTVIIMDDLIDQSGSWIAAAETVVKKGGAQKVYCVATHGLFGDDSLELMENCQCIDFIVVTNSYPITTDRIKASKKLVILDLSNLLAEAIKRNHYGESISQLYQNYQD